MVNELPSVTLSCLKLTNWGELFLGAFPQEAINWADNHYHRSRINAADPFKKVVKLCLDWCASQGVKPLWREMYAQQRIQGQPADAQMYVKNVPKREEAGASSGGMGSSANSAKGLIAHDSPLLENEVLISGRRYRALGATELEARQAAFINNQEAMAGVDKLGLLIGKQSAKDYFRRVFDNLKYEEVVT